MRNLVVRLFIMVFVALNIGAVAYAEDIGVYLDGIKLDFDVPPTTIGDRTMVPMRKIFEAIGVRVEWDEQTQIITATKSIAENKYSIIKMQINSKILNKDGKETALDVAPTVKDGRTLVPVRAVAEALNANVQWSDKNNTVVISTGDRYVYADFPNVPDVGKYYGMTLKSKIEDDEITTYTYSISNQISSDNKDACDRAFTYFKYVPLESTNYSFSLSPTTENGYIITMNIYSKDDIKVTVEKPYFMYDAFKLVIVPKNKVEQLKTKNWKTEWGLTGSDIWVSTRFLFDHINGFKEKISEDDIYSTWTKVNVHGVDFSKVTLDKDNKLEINSMIIKYGEKYYSVPIIYVDDTTVKWFDTVILYPNSYNMTDKELDLVRDGKIWIGMTQGAFKLAINYQPDDINKSVTAYGEHEQWVYRGANYKSRYYYFDNKILTSWQE